ncbi:MAG: methylamine utilization protein [Steroidobacter sp.]|nr:methylamine utilization protein [Steroidobacter sp.]
MKLSCASLILLTTLATTASFAAGVETNVADSKGKPLTNAVVYFVPTQPVTNAKPKHVVIDQVDKEFVPRVTVVQTGTAIDFPNKDDIRHQVYSFSSAKTFQLNLYSGRPSAPIVFDKPGVVVLGCNIHDHMVAWVLSVDTPWFAQTDAKGRAQMSDLPVGKYEMLVWYPGLAQPVSQGQVDSSSPVQRSIQLETGALLGVNTDGQDHGQEHDHGSHASGS